MIGAGLRVPHPQVTGTIETSILSFSSSRDFSTDDLPNSRFALTFDGAITWPDGNAIQDFAGSLLIEAPKTRTGVSTIAGFTVPADSEVVITADRLERTVRIDVTGASLDFLIAPAAYSAASASGFGCENETCERQLVGNRPIRIQTSDGTSTQILLRDPSTRTGFANAISVDRLDFWDTHNIDGVVEQRSGLRSGSLRFLATPDLQREFQRGEIISVKPSRVVMRSVAVAVDSINAQFSGEVDDIQGAIGRSNYSLRPNLLEALSRVPFIKFSLAFITFLFGAGFTLKLQRAQTSGQKKT